MYARTNSRPPKAMQEHFLARPSGRPRTLKTIPNDFVEPVTPGFSSGPYKHNIQKSSLNAGYFMNMASPRGLNAYIIDELWVPFSGAA